MSKEILFKHNTLIWSIVALIIAVFNPVVHTFSILHGSDDNHDCVCCAGDYFSYDAEGRINQFGYGGFLGNRSLRLSRSDHENEFIFLAEFTARPQSREPSLWVWVLS